MTKKDSTHARFFISPACCNKHGSEKKTSHYSKYIAQHVPPGKLVEKKQRYAKCRDSNGKNIPQPKLLAE